MFSIPEISQYKDLFLTFSEKKDGNMANAILGKVTDFDKVLENRRRFLSKLNINIEKSIAMWVLGQDGVAVAEVKDAGVSMLDYQRAVRTDALVTDKQGLYLFLLIADCAPVILYDPAKKVVAVVHVGWKGADLNIVAKTIIKLEDKYGVAPHNLKVIVGPAARKDSFIKESPSQLTDQKWKPFLEKTEDDKYKVDFVGLCKYQMVKAGVKLENIIDSGIDTVKSDNFFSHYRECNLPIEEQGRFACIVGLKQTTHNAELQ